MPVSERTAEELLTEFLTLRTITKLKPSKKQSKAELPDRLEKCEFLPDNSRIGRRTACIRTVPDEKVFEALLSSQFELAARHMIAECEVRTIWNFDKYGFGCESIVYRSIDTKQVLDVFVEAAEQPVVLSKPYTCHTEPVLLRKIDPVTDVLDVLTVKAQPFVPSKDSWKQTRVPKNGVRVLCK